MKRLVMSVSDKGGVGKTLFLRLLAELHMLAGTSVTLIDGDGSVGQFAQCYDGKGATAAPPRQSARPQVLTFDFHGIGDERDQLINVLEQVEHLAIMDLPAASLTALRHFQSEMDFLKLFAALGVETTFVAPLTPFYASLRDVSDLLDFLTGNNASSSSLAVVRNLAMGDADDFAFWNESKTRDRIIAAAYPVIDFPRLKTGILAVLDRYNLPFLDAYNSTHLSIADRNRVHRWIEACITGIQPHQKSFGFRTDHDLLATYRSQLGAEVAA